MYLGGLRETRRGRECTTEFIGAISRCGNFVLGRVLCLHWRKFHPCLFTNPIVKTSGGCVSVRVYVYMVVRTVGVLLPRLKRRLKV